MSLITEGDLELNPDFQRNFIWDRTRQSLLIESILLGLPIPSIYLSQYDDGRLTVVDGLQRLTTLRRFLNDELKLTHLEYLKVCNGKTFSQIKTILPRLQIRQFSQTQIGCYVIDYRSPERLKFDLFRRINTGSKPLNRPEIRNCLSRPYVQDALKEMWNSPEFIAGPAPVNPRERRLRQSPHHRHKRAVEYGGGFPYSAGKTPGASVRLTSHASP